jgi:hypothetical protein
MVTNFNLAWCKEELTAYQKFVAKLVQIKLKEHGYEIKEIYKDKKKDVKLLDFSIKHSNYLLCLDGTSVDEVLIKKGYSYETMNRNLIETSDLDEAIAEVCRRSFWKEGQDIRCWLEGFSDEEERKITNCRYLRPWLRQMKKDKQSITPENLPF